MAMSEAVRSIIEEIDRLEAAKDKFIFENTEGSEGTPHCGWDVFRDTVQHQNVVIAVQSARLVRKLKAEA